jgi:alkylation response protein AidB-like acyl-CoA dehydrogenase
MAVGLSDELKMIEQTVREFAAGELVEGREERDRYPFGPPYGDVLAKAHDVGLFSIMLPEEMGGSPEPVSTLCLILDEVCRVDASLGAILFTCALSRELINRAGEPKALKERESRGDGYEQFLTAFPSFANPREIESGAGLWAVPTNGDYRLSGSAGYVVLGGLAGRALLPARIEKTDGWSLFIVDLQGSGVDAGKPVLSLGLHASPALDLKLTDAPGRLIGETGGGGQYFEAAADRLSVAVASMAAGVMKGSLDTALEYSR